MTDQTPAVAAAADDDCVSGDCDCGEFAPLVIGHVGLFGGDRGYSEMWTFTAPDGEEGQLVIWENGQDVSGGGCVDGDFSFENVRPMVVDDYIPTELLAEGYTMTGHDGPVDDYDAKLAAAWAAVEAADA